MRLIVTGAAGMLGADVLRAAEQVKWDALGITHTDLDVADSQAVASMLRANRPDAVVNCAAYTDVDSAESDVAGVMAVNAFGAGNVAAAAAAVGASVVYPSTDYVFDGTKRVPYVESDTTAPRSCYGRSKLAGERCTAAANERHTIVRTSWLFGVAGRNFVETMLALGSEREELEVVNDQIGCPTYTADLARAIVEVLQQQVNGVVHVAGGGQCSWYEFALEIFRQASVNCSVRPCTTAEFPLPAPRPAFSVLESERFEAPRLAHWHEALSNYLEARTLSK